MHFTRENYLAVAILVCLGVRKTELTSSKWVDIDLENSVWYLSGDKAKNRHSIDIPLPHQVVEWFKELQLYAGDSDFVFPSRRIGKKNIKGHISDDTLNHALSTLFGITPKHRKNACGNVLGDAGIEHFVIHDLRRTLRTLMSKNDISDNVAEKCLNHIKKGVEGIYNRDAFYEKRVLAHQQVADQIAPLVND